jgi:hypothetical protein
VALAQTGQQRILDGVERGEVDMAALGGLHVIAAGSVAPQLRHAKAGAGAGDADRAISGSGTSGPTGG